MDFDLKKPCPNCPFLNNIRGYLRKARIRQIEGSLVRGSFPCHKTVEWDSEGENTVNDREQHHCAGALILLEKLNRPSQMMRVMERIGCYDRTKLDMGAPVFDTFDEMEAAQED